MNRAAFAMLPWVLLACSLAACTTQPPAELREVPELGCGAYLGLPPTGDPAWVAIKKGEPNGRRAQAPIGDFRIWIERSVQRRGVARVHAGVDDRTTGKPIWRMDVDRLVFEQTQTTGLVAFPRLHIVYHPQTGQPLQVQCKERGDAGRKKGA